jgi:hypothetical protein
MRVVWFNALTGGVSLPRKSSPHALDDSSQLPFDRAEFRSFSDQRSYSDSLNLDSDIGLRSGVFVDSLSSFASSCVSCMSWFVLPIGSIRFTKKDADSVLHCMFASGAARLNGWEDLARKYQGPGTPLVKSFYRSVHPERN